CPGDAAIVVEAHPGRVGTHPVPGLETQKHGLEERDDREHADHQHGGGQEEPTSEMPTQVPAGAHRSAEGGPRQFGRETGGTHAVRSCADWTVESASATVTSQSTTRWDTASSADLN